MPHGDRTGPLGGGPKTGRAAGFCAETGVPGYMNPGPGANISEPLRGVGWGGVPWWGGRGRAWGGGRGRFRPGPMRFDRGYGSPNYAYSETSDTVQQEPENYAGSVDSQEIETLKEQIESLKTSIEAMENRLQNTNE